MNAMVGIFARVILADVCHLNFKTFAIPHGGGGPECANWRKST